MWPEQGNQQRTIENQTVFKEGVRFVACGFAGYHQGMLNSNYL